MKYKILNDRIEQMSNVFYFVAMEILIAALMLPALILTFINFFFVVCPMNHFIYRIQRCEYNLNVNLAIEN